MPIPVAPRSKSCVCSFSLAGIAGSNPVGGLDVCLVCCQVEVSATGRSLVQRNPTESGVSECDLQNSYKRRSPTGGCGPMRKKSFNRCHIAFLQDARNPYV